MILLEMRERCYGKSTSLKTDNRMCTFDLGLTVKIMRLDSRYSLKNSLPKIYSCSVLADCHLSTILDLVMPFHIPGI